MKGDVMGYMVILNFDVVFRLYKMYKIIWCVSSNKSLEFRGSPRL